jgi:coenzyme F420-reducing hydrogenase beta subunit
MRRGDRMNMHSYRDLKEKVIDKGYCIGCGACVSAGDVKGTNKLDPYGMYKPSFDQLNSPVSDVCPFFTSRNESELGEMLFSGFEDMKRNEFIGYYLETYAGYVREDDFRKYGSSGGFVTWILSRLLEERLIDAVIHVKPSGRKGILFEYRISSNLEEVRKGAKSRYYPVEFSKILDEVRKSRKKYAFVGIPCFVKAMRLLCASDNEIGDRVSSFVGLVCGHLKSKSFSEMLAWQKGVKPEDLRTIDFRWKYPSGLASEYGIRISGEKNGEMVTLTEKASDFYGYNWGYGFFKYKACDYCDDVVSETADVSVGDAWLPEYVNDSGGTNVVIVRSPLIQKIIDQGIKEKALKLDVLDPEEIVKSQEGGFRHRRDLLAYRIALLEDQKTWFPQKRVEPSLDNLDERYRKIAVLRIKLAEKSHLAFKEALQADDFEVFRALMQPIVEEYGSLYKRSFLSKALSRIKRLFASK